MNELEPPRQPANDAPVEPSAAHHVDAGTEDGTTQPDGPRPPLKASPEDEARTGMVRPDNAADANVAGSEDAVTAESRQPTRRRPESLVDVYTLAKAAVPEFLAGLAKRDAWTSGLDDQQEALRLLDERDPDLAKTRTLAQHVATSHDGRFAASFESFLIRAVNPDLGDTPGWPPSEQAHGPQAFRDVLEYHAQTLGAKEPPRRLFNAVMIAQSVLMARYGLDVPDAVPALSSALGPPAALRGARRNPRLVRLTALGATRLTVDGLRTWLDVLSPWIERAVQAEHTTERAQSELARAQAALQSRELQLSELQRALTEARAEIVELRQELQAKADRERGVTLARQHEAAQLRGSMAGFLGDEVSALLAGVREGLELERPRVSYALERLDDAEHAIEEKVRWLRSSA